MSVVFNGALKNTNTKYPVMTFPIKKGALTVTFIDGI